MDIDAIEKLVQEPVTEPKDVARRRIKEETRIRKWAKLKLFLDALDPPQPEMQAAYQKCREEGLGFQPTVKRLIDMADSVTSALLLERFPPPTPAPAPSQAVKKTAAASEKIEKVEKEPLPDKNAWRQDVVELGNVDVLSEERELRKRLKGKKRVVAQQERAENDPFLLKTDPLQRKIAMVVRQAGLTRFREATVDLIDAATERHLKGLVESAQAAAMRRQERDAFSVLINRSHWITRDSPWTSESVRLTGEEAAKVEEAKALQAAGEQLPSSLIAALIDLEMRQLKAMGDIRSMARYARLKEARDGLDGEIEEEEEIAVDAKITVDDLFRALEGNPKMRRTFKYDRK